MAVEVQVNLGGNFVEQTEKSTKALDGEEKELTAAEKAVRQFEEALQTVEGRLSAIKADPAKFRRLAEAQHELGEMSKKLGGEQDSLKEKLEKVGEISEAGFKFNLVESGIEMFHKLGEAVFEAGEKLFDFGKDAIKAAGAAEDLDLAIKLNVGEEGAEKVNKVVESFKGSQWTAKDLKTALLPMLEESGDEHSDQWDDLLTAATDVATRRHSGAAGMQAALGALRSIEIMPQKVRGALKELGIKQKDFYSDLGSLMGISAESAEKQTKAGQFKAKTLLSVAMHQIAEREGGAIGGGTNEGVKTLGSSLTRLGNLKDTLFERLAKSPGMTSVQRVIDSFLELMEGSTGTEFMGSLDKVIKGLADTLTPEKVKGAIGWVSEAVRDLTGPAGISAVTNGFKAALRIVEGIGSTLRFIVDSVESATSGMTKLLQMSGIGRTLLGQNDTSSAVGAKATLAGRAAKIAGANLSEDAEANLVSLLAKEFNLAPTGVDGMVKALRTKAGPAMSVADNDNMSIPAMAKGGIVSRPTLALVGEAGPEAVIPLSKMGGGGIGNIEVSVIVQGNATADAATAIGREVGIELRKQLDIFAAAMGA